MNVSLLIVVALIACAIFYIFRRFLNKKSDILLNGPVPPSSIDSPQKKVIIIGGGISGLSAGVYAQRNGFQATILEQNPVTGGMCTSWKRKGFLFEGSIHWLSGSSPKHPNHRIWRETGAFNSSTIITYGDPFIVCCYEGRNYCFYRNPEILGAHLREVSPEDSAAIATFIKDIGTFTPFPPPFFDVKGLKVIGPTSNEFSFYWQMLPKLPRLIQLSKISVAKYTSMFKSAGIRALFDYLIEPTYSAVSLFYAIAQITSGDGGYIRGGSLKLTDGMLQRFKELGGEVRTEVKVEKVFVEDGIAKGVIVNGEKILADAVICTRDALSAIDDLFVPRIDEKWADEMRKNTKLATTIFFGIGVGADLSHLPQMLIFPLDNPIQFAGLTVHAIKILNYASQAGQAPPGCSSITTQIRGDTYDFWKKAKDDGVYEQKKQELAHIIITHISSKIPEVEGKVAVVDVATPLTFERYLGSYRGSYMTYLAPGDPMTEYPQKSEKIKNLYFGGWRVHNPGGLPPAVMHGRKAIQYLCKDFGKPFH